MMVWLLLISLSLSIAYGEEEPKIITDAVDYEGFPKNFGGLYVYPNSVHDARYYWKKDGVVIDHTTKPPFRSITENLIVDTGKAQNPLDYGGYYQFFISSKAGIISGRNISVQFTYNGEFIPEQKPGTPAKVQDVTVGQATFLECPKHLPGQNCIYKWGKKTKTFGATFVQNSKYYIVLDDGVLFFSHLLQEHVKTLNDMRVECGMEASVGQDNRFTWSRPVQLNVVETNFTSFGPKMVSPLPKRTFQEGQTISMKCAATGNPLPTYTWSMVDDYNVETTVNDEENGVEFEQNYRILVIKAATRHNSGKYKCTATIGSKYVTVEGHLKFEEKPTWILPLIDSVSPSIYESHSWVCNATGHPQPFFFWYANATKKMESKPGKYIVDGGKISFQRLLKEDSGMYKCVAENEQDNIIQTAYLDVQAVKPTFVSNTGKTTLFLNSDGVLKCYAYAAPTAVNKWMKDGIEIDISLPKYEIVDNTTLVIKQVSKADIGNYTCTASNIYGKDTKKITVEVVGEITFIDVPKSVNVTMGQRVSLKCSAKKEEQLAAQIQYKWFLDRIELKPDQSNTTVLSYRNTLVILEAKVSDSGIYECVAYIDKPSYAEKRRQAIVIVRGPPEAPTNVKVDGGCGNLVAKVTWTVRRKSYSPIERFIIQSVTTYRGNQWRVIGDKVLPHLSEFTVKNLSAYAVYRFRVQAVNSIGTSLPSDGSSSEQCKTPERLPTICPDVMAVAGKANELTVHWKIMDLIDQNGKDFKYRLQYRKTIPVNGVWESTFFSAITANYSIPNASYYQKWELQIQGVNNAGGGPLCKTSSFSGQDAPKKAPEHFKVKEFGSDHVVVGWEPIVVEPGDIDGYMLRYWQDVGPRQRRASDEDLCESKDKACEKDIVGGSRTSFRVDELLPAKSYNMELFGYNSGGAGPPSSLKVVTADGKPSAPTKVTYTPYAKFVKVSWKPPLQPNGIITEYKVSISGTYDKSEIVKADKDFIIFKDLEPNKDHTITIEARTKKGFGKKRRVVVTTTKPSVPTKPKVPGAKGTGDDSVNVTFLEGSPPTGFPETFYTVFREKDSDEEVKSEKQPLYGEDGSSFLVVPDLDAAKEYEFATVAVNYFGESERSDFNSTYPGDVRPVALSSPVYKRDWFVALVVIVCLLLLILLIALLITRKRGERYPVGKREKKRAGILDDAEEPDTDAYPMKPPRQTGNGHNRQNSTGSFANKDPDRDSLDDYGEDKFGEDAASLIGEYNDDRNTSAVEGPEFV